MRRVMYLWLQHWPIDRRRLSRRNNSGAPAEEAPFATVAEAAGRRLLGAVNPAATAAGLAPGMPLADALSFFPGLATCPAEPAEDAAALRRLAEWCSRYSPWTAPDGTDGVRIEITGSAHLWGGEAALAADLAARLDRRHVAGHIAIADTLGAAWAAARFAEAGRNPVILPPGDCRTALAPLPVEALRLDPATAQGLRRVGLKRVGDLSAMPRDALTRRFGEMVVWRLDQAQGDLSEPLSPLGEAPTRRVRLSFAEPIADPADLLRATERLVEDLVPRLAQEGTGARRLDLGFYRVDGRVERIRLGTARPSRDPYHLTALFKERLDTVDPDLGIEDVILAAFAVEPLAAEQIGLAGHPIGNGSSGIAPLLDRLGNRLGLAAVSRLEPRESHIPERASVRVPISVAPAKALGHAHITSHGQDPPLRPGGGEGRGEVGEMLSSDTAHLTLPSLRDGHLPLRPQAGGEGPSPATRNVQANMCACPSAKAGAQRQSAPLPGSGSLDPRLRGDDEIRPPRPIRLFEPPEPVEAFWLLPDDPPFRFAWRRRRHRVTRADGPERIANEWWRPEGSGAIDAIRDYYRVEDEEGRRFWLFRMGLHGHDRPPRWFVHGVFS